MRRLCRSRLRSVLCGCIRCRRSSRFAHFPDLFRRPFIGLLVERSAARFQVLALPLGKTELLVLLVQLFHHQRPHIGVGFRHRVLAAIGVHALQQRMHLGECLTHFLKSLVCGRPGTGCSRDAIAVAERLLEQHSG